MPSLIRFVILLLVLGGLVYGGMVALTLFVDPGEEDVVQEIRARDLWQNTNETRR